MIKQLKHKIEWVLENYPDTRNDDILLTLNIWSSYYKHLLFTNDNGKLCVRLNNIFELPREDNVKRIRAKLQNEQNKWLPTDPEVRRKRGILEEEWRRQLGYNPEMRQVIETDGFIFYDN